MKAENHGHTEPGIATARTTGGIRRDRPGPASGLIAPGAQPAQDHLPDPVPGPAAMPVIDGLPVPEPLRQVPPRAPGPGPEEDSVDHQPVIISPVPLPRVPRQERLQPRPLRITEIMPLQPVLIHDAIQAETARQDLRDTPEPAPLRPQFRLLGAPRARPG